MNRGISYSGSTSTATSDFPFPIFCDNNDVAAIKSNEISQAQKTISGLVHFVLLHTQLFLMSFVYFSLPLSKSTPNISSQGVFELPFQVHQDVISIQEAEMGKEKAKRIPLSNLPVVKPQELNESKYLNSPLLFLYILLNNLMIRYASCG